MRKPVTVRPCTDADRPAVAHVLARAFQDDPALSWLFRNAHDRPRRLDRFFDLICHADADPAHWTLALDAAGQPVAAALWRPPGNWQIPTSAMLKALPRLIRTFGLTLPRALSMQALLDRHHASDGHWYLQFVGCLPSAQGQGFGGAVIRHRLGVCDAQRLPAYLETATPSNVGLYQSLGFRVKQTYGVPEFGNPAGPDFWSMWRDPVAA